MKNKKNILNNICQEESQCPNEHYCILKELILNDSKYDTRLLTQMALIDKFKYNTSFKKKADFGWSNSLKEWVESGYAKKFNDL